MPEIRKLKEAIHVVESQREVLGEKLLNEVLGRLKARLDALVTQRQMVDRTRRTVTILAVHIQQLPEAPAEVISAWQEQLTSNAQAWGGHIEQIIHQSAILSWGIDEERENNVERAIRAGLELRRAALQIFAHLNEETESHPYTFQAGIYTSPIFIGGDTNDQDSSLLLEAFTVARQLQNSAQPNSLVISDETFRSVQGAFNIYQAAPLVVPGKPEPLHNYVVQSAKPRPFPIPTRGVEGIFSKTVGQEDHLRRLMEAWQEVLKFRKARYITTIGEAGSGKSRLMDDMRLQLEYRGEAYRYFEGRSLPQSANVPYALMRDIICNRFQIYASDSPEVMREKLTTGICEFSDENGVEKAHLIGELIGLDFSDSPYVKGIAEDAAQIYQRAVQYLVDVFTIITNDTPSALFVDNIQWADYGSLDVLEKVAAGLRGQPFMLVAMARPTLLDRSPAWGELLHGHRLIRLGALSENEARTLTADIMQKMKVVPQILSESITRGSNGNPYYIEETIKLLVDDGVIQPDDVEWQLNPQKLITCRVPASIREAVLARVEKRTADELRTLYAASVVGRIFWDDLLAYMMEIPLEDICPRLRALQKDEFLFQRPVSRFSGAEEYIFKHHILHQSIYASVPDEIRQRYHARAAQWLETHSGEIPVENTPWVAYHLSRAGMADEAGVWYLRAGQDAARHYANRDARGLLERALELLPESDLRNRFETVSGLIQLRHVLAETALPTQELNLLHDLAAGLDDPAAWGRYHFLRAVACDDAGENADALENCLAVIQHTGAAPSRLEAEAHQLAGKLYFKQEYYSSAREELLLALNSARQLNLAQLEEACLNSLGNISWMDGKIDEALASHKQALDVAQTIGDLRGSGHAHLCMGVAYSSGKDFASSEFHFQRALEMSRRIGERVEEARALNNWGDLYSSRGDFEDAIHVITQALVIFQEVNNQPGVHASLANLGFLNLQSGNYSASLENYTQWYNYCQAVADPRGMALACTGLAQILTAIGQFGRARNYLNQAMTFFLAANDDSGKGRVLMMQGRCAYFSGDLTRALSYLQEALQIPATSKNYESLMATHLTLGHVYTDQAKYDLAHQAYNEAQYFSSMLRDTHLLLEPDAALARLALREDNLETASQLVKGILARITAAPLDFSDVVFWTYLISADVMAATNDLSLRDVVYRAQRMLYTLAEKITDLDIRKSFLENVPHNRRLAALRI